MAALALAVINNGEDNVLKFANGVFEAFYVSGDIANTNTASAALKRSPVLAATGVPVVIGLPPELTPSLSGNSLVLTATANVGDFFGTILVLVKK